MTTPVQITIPETELQLEIARSSGPGGQNVNKVNTKVTVLWNLPTTSALTPEQVALVRQRHARRITSDGVLRVTSQRFRTQGANRDDAIARLHDLVVDALHVDAPRTATRPTRASRERKLREKRVRGAIKATRRHVRSPDDEG